MLKKGKTKKGIPIENLHFTISFIEKRLDKEAGKVEVCCKTCKKHLGFRTNGRYEVLDGTIQVGQGRDKSFLNYCSTKCEKQLKLRKQR